MDDGKRLQELDILMGKASTSVLPYDLINDMMPIKGRALKRGWLGRWSPEGPWLDDGERLQALEVLITKICKVCPLAI